MTYYDWVVIGYGYMISRKQARSSQGSMLGMTAFIGGLLIFACICGFCYYMFFSEQQRAQGKADTETLEMVKLLNGDDRVGQINNTIARNRELVFVSRSSETQASEKRFANWAPLARYLCDEARSSSELVEAERVNQIALAKKAICYEADHFNINCKNNPIFQLPFWHSWDSEVFDITLGSSTRTESNVPNSDLYPELRDWDKQQKYFQEGSNLYRGNINAKLPAPDNDLDFKIASLPAPVDRTVAQARLINPESYTPAGVVFKDMKHVDCKLDQIPTAIHAVQRIWFTAMENDQQIQIGSSALTGGAQQPPQ
jgi:hypothetical protein